MTSPANPVYMDNHATTRLDPRVREAMLPWMGERWGNPGSVGHLFGDQAREAVTNARANIAGHLGAGEQEIIFTSGATESNNLAICGIAERPRQKRKHLVSVVTEHVATRQPLQRLAQRGYEVTLLPVRQNDSEIAGTIDLDLLRESIRGDTCLVSVMLANNETGVIQPLRDIADICHEKGVALHSDATQAVGKIPVDVNQLDVDLLSFSGHKFYGPPGIGALYVRSRPRPQRLDPQIVGGGQQQGRRSGTLNVPGIVGLNRALECCVSELPTETKRLCSLRNQLWQELTAQIPDIQLCGPRLDARLEEDYPQSAPGPLRLPGNLNVSLGDVDGATLQLAIPELAISNGAACSAESPEPSHVLLALGMPETAVRSSLRFGLGRFNTKEEIEWAATQVATATAQLRQLSN